MNTENATSPAKENKDLKSFYNSVYEKGEKQHYTQFRLADGLHPVEFFTVRDLIDWKGKQVLDVGCGTGDMCALVADMGAEFVLGIDYAEAAIEEAKQKYTRDNLRFEAKNFFEQEGKVDVVMSLGTLEHMDQPLKTLQRFKEMLLPGGSIIITSPNWSNTRGHILQTLLRLGDAPITKADIHYFTPIDFQAMAETIDMHLEWETVDQAWGGGQKMIDDFKRRLPNVYRDMGLDTPESMAKIQSFIQWLEQSIVPLDKFETEYGGAVGVYHFTQK